MPKAHALATFDDYANLEYPAVRVENSLEEWRQIYSRIWTAFAMSLRVIEKDHLQVRDLIKDAEKSDVAETMCDIIREDQEVFREMARIVDMAQLRLLAGYSRLMKERGERY